MAKLDLSNFLPSDLSLAPPSPSNRYDEIPGSRKRHAAPSIEFELLPGSSPASHDFSKSRKTINFKEITRQVKSPKVGNCGFEQPRLDLLRRDTNEDGCDLSLSPPAASGELICKNDKGKIPAQERYLKMKKVKREKTMQEIKERKTSMPKDNKKQQIDQNGYLETSPSSSSPSST